MAEQNVNVVIGASGGAGAAVVRVLAAQGKRVRAVGRHPLAGLPAGVEGVVGDCTDPAQAAAFCQDAAAIYLCANVPYHQWEQVFPSIIAGAIAGAKSSGGKLVFCDNLYMYAPTGTPLTEQSPLAPITRKGKLRVRLAEQLFAAHQRGEIRMAIGRTSDFYGPRANSMAGDRFMAALLAGKPLQWLGNPDVPHALTYLDDFAHGLVTLGEHDEALGHVWHIPAGEEITARQFFTLACEEVGRPVKIMRVTRQMLWLVGLTSPDIRETAEMFYQFDRPFLLDASKFRTAFGGASTPHCEALRRTIAEYRQQRKQ
jgi:nucleoside-diphosphate-sugar epimerase